MDTSPVVPEVSDLEVSDPDDSNQQAPAAASPDVSAQTGKPLPLYVKMLDNYNDLLESLSGVSDEVF